MTGEAVAVKGNPAKNGEPVMRCCQVADVPADVSDTALLMPKSGGYLGLVEEPDGAVVGQTNLLDGRLQSGHGNLS